MTPFGCVRSRRSGSVRQEIGVVENFTALFLFFENEEKFQKVGQTTTVVLITLQVKPLKVRFDILIFFVYSKGVWVSILLSKEFFAPIFTINCQ